MNIHDVKAAQMLLYAGARMDDFNPEEGGGEAPSTAPALRHAARRMSPSKMVSLLLYNGPDPQ